MVADCPVEFVRMSAVRTAVLDAVVEAPARTRDLVERLDASESAVYEGIRDLADRGIIDATDGVWEPTGVGTVVADLLGRQRNTVEVLQAAPEYWESHDVTALPREFRECLGALSGFEVVAGTDTDPGRALRTVRHRLEDADRIEGVATVYHDRIAATMRETGATLRFVLARSLVEGFVSEPPPPLLDADAEVRTAPADFSIAVTGDCLCLSLPAADGSPDIHTQLVADGDAAMRWGRELFETCWAEGVHPREVVDDPDAWPAG